MNVRPHLAGAQPRLKALVAERVRERLQAGELAMLPAAERRLRVGETAMTVLREHRVVLSSAELTRLVNEISDEVVGLGPVESLLKDPEVTEVMVNGADDVYVERKGRLERVGRGLFEGEEAVLHVMG